MALAGESRLKVQQLVMAGVGAAEQLVVEEGTAGGTGDSEDISKVLMNHQEKDCRLCSGRMRSLDWVCTVGFLCLR